jgi:hypothetical protein
MWRKIFERNYEYITAHNAEADKGLHTFRLGVNQFADMTFQEYQQLLTLRLNVDHVNTELVEEVVDQALHDSVDWRSKNVVTHVKDQGQV